MFWSRKSLRLPEYDYSQTGAYFVTICVQRRKCLFGRIRQGEMQLSPAGFAVARWWQKLPGKFPSATLDPHYVVMPNHFHGIIFLANPSGPPAAVNTAGQGGHAGPPLPRLIQWFKTMSTNEYTHGVKEQNWPPLVDHLWQRGYYEHVIRDDDALNRVREYIQVNPRRWELDRENPRAQGKDAFDQWLASFHTKADADTRRGGPAGAPPEATRRLGDYGEDLAAAALKKQGYKILERNYVTPLGEIDLIARHRDFLVFVEVKTRQSLAFGGPEEAVSRAKQKKLRDLAAYYLKRHRLDQANLRFDVVSIILAAAGPQVEIIESAF